MQQVQNILAAILNSRGAYDTFRKFGDRGDLGPLGNLVFDAVHQYYTLDPTSQKVDRELLEQRIASSLTNPKHAESYRGYMRELPADVSGPNIQHDIRELRARRVGESLSIAIINQGQKEEIKRLHKEYGEAIEEAPVDEDDGVYGISEAVSGSDPDAIRTPIRLWPDILNTHTAGGAEAGNLIVIFARVGTGKTIFTINMCASFVRQGKRVLYLGNEEPTGGVRDRALAVILRASVEAVRKNPTGAWKAYEKRGLAKIMFRDIDTTTSWEYIHGLVAKHKPEVVVLDQLHKIPVQADVRVNELERQAAMARDLAKRAQVLVIAITQAGMSADGKAVLDMTDVDGSKTGIPANADLMLGIGKTNDMWKHGMLEVAICKNKLAGSHDHFTIHVDPITQAIT